jgi:hypothetical protein
MGARDDTQGHEALAAARLAEAWLAEAWLAAAVAGPASSPASAAAAISRPFLYRWWFDES